MPIAEVEINSLADRAIAQDDDELFRALHAESNSIAVLVRTWPGTQSRNSRISWARTERSSTSGRSYYSRSTGLLAKHWRDADWRDADWRDADWRDADWRDADWRDADWRDADWRDADWRTLSIPRHTKRA